MNRLSTIFNLVCLAVLSGAPTLLAQAAPASETQLLQMLQKALKSKDKAAILALYNWDGVPAWVKDNQSDDIDDWLTRDLASAQLSPLPTNFPSAGEFSDIRFHLNVQPVGIIQLGFADGFGEGFPCGKIGNTFYIATVIAEDIAFPSGNTNVLIIHVQSPDGQPLPHAAVVIGHPRQFPTLRFRKLFGEEMFADGQGNLHWPSMDTNAFLVAASGRGFGWLPIGSITNQAIMIVQPWGQIEGQLKNRNRVLSNVRLSLAIDRDFYQALGMVIRLDGQTLTSDAQGRFTFEHVPPLRLIINRQDPLTGWDVGVFTVSALPGQTNHLDINHRGRTVVGHLVKGPGLDAALDLSSCSTTFTETVPGRNGTVRTAHFQVSSNGTLQAALVEPGDYKITGSLSTSNEMVALIDSRVVHVPDDLSDAPDAPYDAGSVTLKAAVNLKPGDIAPEFNVKDLNGKPLKLADYHGKYVLLDFWATWCGPCVGETPNMKAIYDAFGKNARFAMISLSLDSDPAAPKRFARNRDLVWTQGFLGDWSNDKVTATYGVYGIPAIFLIGPDGKIVATDLRGARIHKTVAAALGR